MSIYICFFVKLTTNLSLLLWEAGFQIKVTALEKCVMWWKVVLINLLYSIMDSNNFPLVMKTTVIDKILTSQALKNEKRVASIRLLLASFAVIDFLDYFELISFYPTPPNLTTIVISVFLLV